MSADRELLEMAAKAAGVELMKGSIYNDADGIYKNHGGWWNPLEDDGDALRLAVKLGLRVFTPDIEPTAVADRYPCGPRAGVDAGNDPYAATRRAIVRAAAAIERAKP